MMLEVGINGLALDYPHSGSAVYARSLVPLLPQVAPEMHFRLFTRWAAAREAGIPTRRLTTPFAPFNRGPGVRARLDKLTWEVGAFPVAAALHRESLLHSLYFALPPVASARSVVTVHDVIPFVLPSYHRSRQSALYSRFMAWSVRRSASAVITVSQHARDDILRVLRLPWSQVHVTYEAVDERFQPTGSAEELQAVRVRYGLPDRFVLYAGGSERRKNLETLIRAWARVRQAMRRADVTLVVVAHFPAPDPLYPDVPGLATSLGLEDIVFIPAVDEADKPALYRAALAFCFPSTYEGFGFPPLEAMASGVPTLSSDAASLPEVVGNGGILLPPENIDGWAEAIQHIVECEVDRQDLRRRGLAQAATFSWHRTAEETVRIYRTVLNR